MAVNFPSGPANNATHTEGGKTWTYDGTIWQPQSSGSAGGGSFVDAGSKTLTNKSVESWLSLPAEIKKVEISYRDVSKTVTNFDHMGVQFGSASSWFSHPQTARGQTLSGGSSIQVSTGNLIPIFTDGTNWVQNNIIFSGILEVSRIDGNQWSWNAISNSDGSTNLMSMIISNFNMGAELTRIRIMVTHSGSFDSGNARLRYWT